MQIEPGIRQRRAKYVIYAREMLGGKDQHTDNGWWGKADDWVEKVSDAEEFESREDANRKLKKRRGEIEEKLKQFIDEKQRKEDRDKFVNRPSPDIDNGSC